MLNDLARKEAQSRNIEFDFAPFCGEGLNRSPTSYQVDDQNDHGYYEQQMDQAAANV
jgi:hypothetical protein